jgi:hypothetical protein
MFQSNHPSDDWENRGIISISVPLPPKLIPTGNVYCYKTCRCVESKGMRMYLIPFEYELEQFIPGWFSNSVSAFCKEIRTGLQMCIKVRTLTTRGYCWHHSFCSFPDHIINIADLVVMSTAQASSTIVNKNYLFDDQQASFEWNLFAYNDRCSFVKNI